MLPPAEAPQLLQESAGDRACEKKAATQPQPSGLEDDEHWWHFNDDWWQDDDSGGTAAAAGRPGGQKVRRNQATKPSDLEVYERRAITGSPRA